MEAADSGAAGQVRRRAAERVSLAEALERGDRREPWVILADALHTADVLMREAKAQVVDGVPVTVDLIDKLIDATERATRMAKINADASIDERRTQVAEQQLRIFNAGLAGFLAAIGATDEQRAVVPAALRQMRLSLEGRAGAQ